MISKFDLITDPSALGNKAQSLILLRQAGFPVPDGFVLDQDSYRELIAENGIADILDVMLRNMTKENAGQTGAQIRAMFDRLTLGSAARLTLWQHLKSDTFYAVRSSGSKEDLEDYSFAGQYETFLNVAPTEVEQYIIKCYRSMFSETVLSYMLNNGLSFKDIGMTVIVQEMVPSEYSGICFTLNPITGNDREMVIEVGEGLGEGIVSGKVAPEQYYYDWYDKTLRIDEGNRLLDRAVLERMTSVFADIQQFYGYPCDIEFGITDGELFILQARKITKINYQGIKDIWTTADFRDGISATVCLPFMWSLYEYIWEYTLKKFVIESKMLKEQDVDKKVGEMFYGRGYWNLSVVKQSLSQVVGYREREFDSEYGIKINYDGEGETTKLTLKSLADVIRIGIAQKKIQNTRRRNAQRYKDELLEKYNAYKTAHDVDRIGNIKSAWLHLTRDDYLQSESTYFWQIFINTVYQALHKDRILKYVSEGEYLTLLGNINDISHLLPFYKMWDISRQIRADKVLLREWQKTDAAWLAQRVKNGAEGMVWDAVRRLIANYGYHSEMELDVSYPCYYEDFTPMIVSIKEMIELDDSFSPPEDRKKGRKAQRAVFERIRDQYGPYRSQQIRKKIIKMHRMLWWREELRDVSTRFYYIIRVYTLRLAKQLYREGVLNAEEDIWYLKAGHLWDHLEGRLSPEELRDIIEKNKRYYNAYRCYLSENEIGSALSAGEANEDRPANGLRGVGANSGTVTGTARVITSFDEIDRLQKGDILITRFTDTGWTPKFAVLSGIVTEYGGILCHAAIVSREYGIPAIVSCQNVMAAVKDGQTVTIDGAAGTITIKEAC